MSMNEISDALKKVVECETSISHGELTFHFCNLKQTEGEQPDWTSAFLPHSNGFNNNESNDLSFLRFLSGDFSSQPIVLVSKIKHGSFSEEAQCNVLAESTPASAKSIIPRRNIQSNQDTSDVWGSPLKCGIPSEDESITSLSFESSQMSTDTRKSRPKHLGIPFQMARKIVSAYNVSNVKDLPPLLVVCDGNDLNTTALMGVKQFKVQKNSHPAKGLKIATVAMSRKGNADIWTRKARVGGTGTSGRTSQVCQSVYQVNTQRQNSSGTVAIEIKWKEANRLLEAPPMEASSTVKACVQSGSMQTCLNIYQELQFLERIITALRTGQMEWITSSGDKSTISLVTSVKNFINELQEERTLGNPAAQGEEEEDETWTFTSALKSFHIPERKDYDFTDRLWKVMMDCMSTPDLISSLRLVFNALGHGQLRPFLDRHNQTTVAQIVRESFTGRFSSPSLTGVQPYLFLAEIGAEKLRRDYIQVFVSQRLATPSSLEHFTSLERELDEKLEDLNKLHNVLEMMVLLGSSLRLPADTLGIFARQMLSHYRQHSVDPEHSFSFPVKTSEVRYVYSSIPPVVWSVETTSDVSATENESESSLHCLSITQPFHHMKESSSNNGEKADELAPVQDSKSNYFLVQRKENIVIL